MRRAMALVVCALVVAPLSAWAYTCNGTGCTWNTRYTEPSTLTNAQPLTDLTGCTATYTFAVDGGAPSAPKVFAIAASRPTGGQLVNKTNIDATMAPGHTYLISETVACASTAFGTGAPSAPATLLMNNGVAPSPGTGLTLQ
jgi:hypothetical protein